MAEQLTISSKSEFCNYLRLQILVNTSSEILRKSFITQWNLMHSLKWEDTASNRQDFITGPGKTLYKKSQKIQKEHLNSRNITEWDLPLMIQAAKSLNINIQDNILEELKSLRNELAHLGEPKINDKEYRDYWHRISGLLLQLHIPQEKIDEVKTMPIEVIGRSPQTVDPKVQELKKSGNEAFKEGNFDVSIDFYTEAISIPGVSNEDLAVLYSNRSAAFLNIEDVLSAKEDAKTSIHVCPTWWRGYYRLAMAYKTSKKYQHALKSLMLAQQFHGKSSEIEDQINLCKRAIAQKSRKEHLDPRYFCSNYEEMAERHPFSNADFLRYTDNFGIKYLGPIGMCTQAHKYYHGRDVKQDYEEAAKWFGKAAEKGNAEGMYNLGTMMIEEKGVKCDFSTGIRLLIQAASQPNLITVGSFQIPNIGVMEAQHSLGLLYELGTGVPQDYEKARSWYTCAIRNWSGASANNVAIMYANGKGVPRCPDLAFQYWKLGAALGDVRCMENLVNEYFLLEDFENLQQWYLYAIERGSIALKLRPELEYKGYCQEWISKNFKKEEFMAALWIEVEIGPLKHLIDPEVKSTRNLSTGLPTLPGISDFGKFFGSWRPAYRIETYSGETYKKSIILAHRKLSNNLLDSGYVIIDSWGNKPNKEHKPVTNLFNLRPIYLEEMNKRNKDRIYEGFVLKLTVVEDPIDKESETSALHSIVRDEQGLYQRLSVYNYHPSKNDLQKNLGFGTKISIVNPYYRIAKDGSPAIRVDDFNTVLIHPDSKNDKICRYCSNDNYTGPAVPCQTCRRCYYCCEKCLKLDASELQHILVCKKQI